MEGERGGKTSSRRETITIGLSLACSLRDALFMKRLHQNNVAYILEASAFASEKVMKINKERIHKSLIYYASNFL